MDIIIECPHCQGTVLVNKKDFNCMIFRHGILKENGKQLDPHLPKKECDEYFNNNKIYGCSKPFQILMDNNNYIAKICDYI